MNQYEIMKNNTLCAIKVAFIKSIKENGYYKTTVNNICKEAAIHRTSFYRYYDSIDEMLHQIEDEIFKEILTDTNILKTFNFKDKNDKHQYVHDAFVNLLNTFYKNKDFLIPIMGPNGDPYFVWKYKSMIIEGFELTFKHNNIHLGKYERYFFITYTSCAVDTIHYWLEHQNLSIDEFADFFENFFYNSFTFS